jgi:hypothetical protein
MHTWIKSKRKHLIFWTIFLLYLFSANPLYSQYFLKDGKPLSSGEALPAINPNITVRLDERLALVRSNGQDFYELKGFAYLNSAPLRENKIYVVLHSMTQTLVFPTSLAADGAMIRSYSAYKPGMDHAEFLFTLARDIIQPGTYQVGVLIEDQENTSRSYSPTGSLLKTTPNTVTFVPGL